MKLLLDTHVLIRWMAEPKKLSKNQSRRDQCNHSDRNRAPVHRWFAGIKTVTAAGLFDELSANPAVQILPLSVEIAQEVLNMGRALRDPADRTIAATARIHGLRLLTSDQRIIESNLVQTVD